MELAPEVPRPANWGDAVKDLTPLRESGPRPPAVKIDGRSVGQIVLAEGTNAARFAAEPDSQIIHAQATVAAQPESAGPSLPAVGLAWTEPRPLPLAPRLAIEPLQDGPLGYAGRSGVRPREIQQTSQIVPVEDRWRIGFPQWDRYGKGHPRNDDYPYVEGRWWDPFNQNVLKGDYPILGQNIFLEITATSVSLLELRENPTGTTPFESTANPDQKDFFGKPGQLVYVQNMFLTFDLFRGDAAFRPVDWRIRATPAFNINSLAVNELGVVSPDVRKGVTRDRTFATLQEWFVETKIADIGPDYDFVSARVGSQPFTSDFRGFIFTDVNRGVRVFGNRLANRDQFNFAYFNMQEKDTNSGLNSFRDRHQQIAIFNYYRQDFIWPGYTAQVSMHYNHDSPTFKFDQNGFLVRPDPVGVFQPHTVDVAYLGWAGDGHINSININHAVYWAVGHDTQNPLANQAQNISAYMAALELSYDQDWIRFRVSGFYSSGDRNINNGHATGFDSIMDSPQFAGGEFSYWQRQQLRLFGVNLVQGHSLVPDLRSSKTQGQSNFVNPGLLLANFGFDLEVTPKWRIINNANVLWFDSVQPLQQFLYAQHINRFIGVDLSTGVEYRPFLNNNVIFKAGFATIIPGAGFRDLFNGADFNARALYAGFIEATLTF